MPLKSSQRFVSDSDWFTCYSNSHTAVMYTALVMSVHWHNCVFLSGFICLSFGFIHVLVQFPLFSSVSVVIHCLVNVCTCEIHFVNWFGSEYLSPVFCSVHCPFSSHFSVVVLFMS